MPYNPSEQTVATKLFGVALKINDIGRQQFLIMMRERPKEFKLQVFGITCYITYQDKDYILGYIRQEYSSLLNSHECEVQQWSITGGYPIEQNGETKIATLGMNIIIKLTYHVNKNNNFAKIKPINIHEWNC